MVIMYPSIEFYGEYFTPSKLETELKINFHNKHERGEIAINGKYKNKEFPFGSASLVPQKELVNESDKLLWLANFLFNNKTIIITNGATDITFHIDIDFQYQCNFDFDPIILKKISELNIPLTITCWNKTDEKEFK